METVPRRVQALNNYKKRDRCLKTHFRNEVFNRDEPNDSENCLTNIAERSSLTEWRRCPVFWTNDNRTEMQLRPPKFENQNRPGP